MAHILWGHPYILTSKGTAEDSFRQNICTAMRIQWARHNGTDKPILLQLTPPNTASVRGGRGTVTTKKNPLEIGGSITGGSIIRGRYCLLAQYLPLILLRGNLYVTM